MDHVRIKPLLNLLLTVCFCLCAQGLTALAQETDPHRIYEQNCGGCHAAHAGDFVFDSLVQSGDRLVGKQSNRDVREFLEAGHGKVPISEIDILMEHLRNIQKSGRLYRDKCIICHQNAVRLARSRLIIRDGVLIGRYTDQDIELFLSGHGRLTQSEVPKMVVVLSRQLLVR